jgi:hypothetical protein
VVGRGCGGEGGRFAFEEDELGEALTGLRRREGRESVDEVPRGSRRRRRRCAACRVFLKS